jgi:hypothetical protein
MKGFDLVFIPKPFGNSTSWQAIHCFGDSQIAPPDWGGFLNDFFLKSTIRHFGQVCAI